jgi:hypothetical protein
VGESRQQGGGVRWVRVCVCVYKKELIPLSKIFKGSGANTHRRRNTQNQDVQVRLPLPVEGVKSESLKPIERLNRHTSKQMY